MLRACNISEGVFRLQKKLLALPMAAILSMGLTGCGTNEDAGVERSNEIGQPVGYYSNEKHGSRGGNARVEDGTDNDGPLTEMMDHTLGGEGKTPAITSWTIMPEESGMKIPETLLFLLQIEIAVFS